jgi:hypothetical protein
MSAACAEIINAFLSCGDYWGSETSFFVPE